MMTDSGPLLFALGATRDFGEQVARELGVPLAPGEERAFEDGEHKGRPLCSVRGRDVYVAHSLYGDAGERAGEKLCKLLFFIGALKDGGAARVTALAPYLAFARKDRKTQPRDPVTTRYVAQLFEAVGADGVVTLDVHNLAAFQNAFRRGAENLEARNLFVAHFAPLLQGAEVAVVSPDAGGIKRAERLRTRLAEWLGRPIAAAFMEKYRSLGVVSGDLAAGELAGRTAIVVDDLVGSGTTLARAALACRRLGASRVYACASHGLFVGEAATQLALPELDGLVVTDAVPPWRLPPGPVRGKLAVLPVAPLFASAVRCLHEGGSLTGLLEG